jgi:hypothetical protein
MSSEADAFWRYGLKAGSLLEVLDDKDMWRAAVIRAVKEKEVHVVLCPDLPASDDEDAPIEIEFEWIDRSSDRLAASGHIQWTEALKEYVADLLNQIPKATGWRAALAVGSVIDAQDCEGTWYTATVVKVLKNEELDLEVHFHGWTNESNEFISRNSERIEPVGTKAEWREDVQPEAAE